MPGKKEVMTIEIVYWMIRILVLILVTAWGFRRPKRPRKPLWKRVKHRVRAHFGLASKKLGMDLNIHLELNVKREACDK